MTTASESSHPAELRREVFATTRWTQVLSAGRRSSPESEAALAELCQMYWFPLYAYVRRQGQTKEDAEDLVQAFFARFLQKNYLEGLEAERGKFRAFLLASLKHFIANEWDRARAQKRGGGALHLTLDWALANERLDLALPEPVDPERSYDREWALALLDRVMVRLEVECERSGKAAPFAVMKRFLTFDSSVIPYADAAAELGLEEASVRVTVHRLRRRYRELLREEIAQTLNDPKLVDEELRSLAAALTR